MVSRKVSMVLTALLVLAAAAAAPAQTTWYVDAANCPGGSGTPGDPFCTIQQGVDAALAGDTVEVADGVYAGTGNQSISFSGKAVEVRSVNGPAQCVIDCAGGPSAFYFATLEPAGAIVRGFTIRDAGTAGIVVQLSTPTIVDCVITGCQGGGIRCFAAGYPTLVGCTIAGNRSSFGGGIRFTSDPFPVTVRDCTITGNEAETYGGGVYVGGTDVIFVNCVVADNVAGTSGGGVYVQAATPDFVQCTVAGNTAPLGGGIDATNGAGTGIVNSIVWANSGGAVAGAAVTSYSDVEGGLAGDGNIDSDPLFVDAPNGDYRLAASSPCIDSGRGADVPTGVLFDLAGEPRFVNDPAVSDCAQGGDCGGAPVVDMGAYEFLAAPECGEGNVDLAAGSAVDVLRINGSSGGASRTVPVAVADGIRVELASAPGGPTQGRYVLWFWRGVPASPTMIQVAGGMLGCAVNPLPFGGGGMPQPVFCLRGQGIPSSACGHATPKPSPSTTPWQLEKPSGVGMPLTLTGQGLVEDATSSHPSGFSVTNAVILDVR